MPPDNVAFGHPGAMRFVAALISQDWSLAEQHFAAEPDMVGRDHLVAVAAEMGGRPDRLTSWVEGAPDPSLALLTRGALGVRWAWDARSSARAEYVGEDMFEVFWDRLRVAEADLQAAAGAAPDSPLPWVRLLDTARGLQIPRLEADGRYRRHIERGALLSGHLAYQQFVCEKWYGSHDEMWAFTEQLCGAEPAGSTALALAPMAFIEAWANNTSDAATAGDLLVELGKGDLLRNAAASSYGHRSFAPWQPDAVQALSIFFTQALCVEDWPAAKQIIPLTGNRFSDSPMDYFSDQPWPVLRDAVLAR